jgi:hypothetical protein
MRSLRLCLMVSVALVTVLAGCSVSVNTGGTGSGPPATGMVGEALELHYGSGDHQLYAATITLRQVLFPVIVDGVGENVALVTLTVANRGDRVFTLSAADLFRLKAADGSWAKLVPTEDAKDISLSQVLAGKTKTGLLFYRVPAGSSPGVFIFRWYGGETQATWQL